ncbi:MAG: hypothetical protein ABR530_10445 [Pyrinomonadaceae bacterium]
MIILFQIGGTGLFVAACFFLILLVGAVIAFKMMKRTVKMMFRITIVGVILLVAIIGSFALYALTSGTSDRAQPTRSR